MSVIFCVDGFAKFTKQEQHLVKVVLRWDRLMGEERLKPRLAALRATLCHQTI